MTDRADEIAIRWSSEATSKMAEQIRAYGDERANAALKSMNKVVDDERSARLERNPRLRREIRNAALEEAATVPVPFRHANTEAARAIHAAIRALKETDNG